MTQDNIVEMARQAKLPYYWNDNVPCHLKQLEAFAKLVAAKERERASKVGAQAILTAVEKEREACAKVCKSLENNDSDWDSHHWNQAVQRCEYAIRARQ